MPTVASLRFLGLLFMAQSPGIAPGNSGPGLNPGPQGMLGKHSTTELCLQPLMGWVPYCKGYKMHCKESNSDCTSP